jgi:DNA-binding MarR family transcriptional regulator
LQQQSGIPHTYYEILVRLSEAPGRALRMGQLAENSQSSRSRLSHAVARLEESGWIRREAFAGDRRGALAVLTDAGYAALAAAAPGHVDSVRSHLFDQLSEEEQAQLGAICAKVRSHLGALDRHPTRPRRVRPCPDLEHADGAPEPDRSAG